VFSIQDLIIKLLSGDYPLHQAMVIRSLTALPLLLLLVVLDGGVRSLASPRPGLMIGRGIIMFTAYTSYYLGLAALPIAKSVVLYFTAPLFITMLSVVMLGETVGPRRWAAVAIGFVGVLSTGKRWWRPGPSRLTTRSSSPTSIPRQRRWR
jgi:drug/metabolite transporter (DMT)-like permease